MFRCHPLLVRCRPARGTTHRRHASLRRSPRGSQPQRNSSRRLTASASGTFGKLSSYSVDGSVYAQPLYVPGLTIGGTPRNVLFVATMNDKVYAFDADSTSSPPLWIRDFTNPPSVTPVPITDITVPNFNIVGNVGITSTPVIDTLDRDHLSRRAHEGERRLRATTARIGHDHRRVTRGKSRSPSPVRSRATRRMPSPARAGGLSCSTPRCRRSGPRSR